MIYEQSHPSRPENSLLIRCSRPENRTELNNFIHQFELASGTFQAVFRLEMIGQVGDKDNNFGFSFTDCSNELLINLDLSRALI